MPSSSQSPPNHVEVLVCGGGPAGSYTAAALAREGIQVAILEAAKFPRYHIGESLIPSVRPYLRFIEAEEKVVNYGFMRKPGAAIKFNQYKAPGYTDFVALGHDHNSWNVIRSEFDQLLLEHARSSGALVYEQTRVTSLSFAPSDPSRPISASWAQSVTDGKVKGTTTFTYLVDASGRAGIMSVGHLKNRHFNSSLKNVAVWGYWRHTGTYGEGTSRAGAPWFEALEDESGWAWFIPLHDGTTSVGIVMNQEAYNMKGKPWMSDSPRPALNIPNASKSGVVSRYVASLSLAPNVTKFITEQGQLVEGSIKSASDFSYSASSYAGAQYRIVGDAGAFIDPFFSSGVHLAMNSALSAASTICASIRNHCTEQEACNWHTQRVATSYTRFQVVVLSAYKQIRAQDTNVLCDVDEDSFDRAFAYLRPIIQGASDMGARLSETELQKSLDFCVNLFNPTSPEQHSNILQTGKVPQELLDVTSPVMDPARFEKILRLEGPDRATAQMVADKVNARRVVQAEYSIHNFEAEKLVGFTAVLQRGKLGLVRC